jgi:hypothetical protein
MMRSTMRRGLAALLLAGSLAAGPASMATPTTASAAGLHAFEGPVLKVNRDHNRFLMRTHERGKVRVKVNQNTSYEHLRGFGALHRGKRVRAEVRHHNGHWVADEVERALPH